MHVLCARTSFAKAFRDTSSFRLQTNCQSYNRRSSGASGVQMRSRGCFSNDSWIRNKWHCQLGCVRFTRGGGDQAPKQRSSSFALRSVLRIHMVRYLCSPVSRWFISRRLSGRTNSCRMKDTSTSHNEVSDGLHKPTIGLNSMREQNFPQNTMQ
jgi:hypothetical protein